MGFKTFLDGFTRGRPQKEPPTPYGFASRPAGLGIGVSNLAFQQPFTRMRDSYRGAQGIQVQRNLAPLEGALYIAKNSLPYVDIVALASGINVLPGPTPLISNKKG